MQGTSLCQGAREQSVQRQRRPGRDGRRRRRDQGKPTLDPISLSTFLPAPRHTITNDQFWDPRQEEAIRTYTQHFDYISDFTYFDDKRQLISTSGDGHLSAIDIRSNKAEALTVSDDQEDELLSIAQIKGGNKCVVGSTLGILTVWNRKMGWGDCVDRLPGHPASVDAIVALTDDIVATGSEDGMVRVMQILPTKFCKLHPFHLDPDHKTASVLTANRPRRSEDIPAWRISSLTRTDDTVGVIATHEEYPIERLAVDKAGKFLGSVSHDLCIKLTDIEDLFEESDGEDEEEDSDAEGGEDDGSDSDAMDVDDDAPAAPKKGKKEEEGFYDDL